MKHQPVTTSFERDKWTVRSGTVKEHLFSYPEAKARAVELLEGDGKPVTISDPVGREIIYVDKKFLSAFKGSL